MTLTLNISGDFALVTDNLIPVTLTMRGTGTIYSIAHALRTQAAITEHAPSGGDVKAGDLEFQFPASESVSSHTNLLGSKIADETGSDYTILSANYQIFSSKWSVRTRDLIVEAGLNTTVTLAACSYYKHSSSGEAVETWATVSADVRAKIQLETAEVTINHHADETNRTYRITLESELSVIPGASYRIVGPSGETYRMVSYHASSLNKRTPHDPNT